MSNDDKNSAKNDCPSLKTFFEKINKAQDDRRSYIEITLNCGLFSEEEKAIIQQSGAIDLMLLKIDTETQKMIEHNELIQRFAVEVQKIDPLYAKK